jgi:protoporphyrinogen oxidase
MSSAPVQILGAGLTGMSAGHQLGEGYEIHEKSDRPGGLVITSEERGYRFDRTGHLLHLRDAEMRRWVEQLLGESAIAVQRKSRIFSHGVYTRYPYQANTYGLPPRVAFECLYGFLQALREQPQLPEPENFEQFCLRYFGEGFSRHFMIPIGSWATTPSSSTRRSGSASSPTRSRPVSGPRSVWAALRTQWTSGPGSSSSGTAAFPTGS